jgi:hypothetical protein
MPREIATPVPIWVARDDEGSTVTNLGKLMIARGN